MALLGAATLLADRSDSKDRRVKGHATFPGETWAAVRWTVTGYDAENTYEYCELLQHASKRFKQFQGDM